MEKQNRIFPPGRQYHCLLHFIEVPDSYLSELLEKTGNSLSDAKELMKAPGSKFHHTWAESPLSLWEKMDDFTPFIVKEEVRKDGNLHIAFQFPEDAYPQGIGFDGIVSRDRLPLKELKKIDHVNRNGFDVACIRLKDIPETHEMHLVLDSGHPSSVITFFPGTYAPPFPRKEFQSEEDYTHNLSFWDNHLLIL